MPEKGTVIKDRYEVRDMIGSGGTSTVYLVADRHIGRPLAMKVMDGRKFGALKFARSEIETLRCVRFPLFPLIHDAFCENGDIYIISEYVKGVSLRELCMRKGMKKDECLRISQHICEALVYLHGMERPMLYLDLKPENIIISEDGLPHLIDFGIAGWLAAKHIPVGTRGYSPPEQYDPGGRMDERADIFAFAMTYYAMRHGIPPDPSYDEAIRAIKHSRVLDPSERSFLTRCCAYFPEDRYTCTKEVLRQIRHIRSIPERFRKRTVAAAITAATVLMTVFAAEGLTKKIKRSETAETLMKTAAQTMENGTYSDEGIGIIKTVINSGVLPDETEQELIFEVAVHSMLISKDYKTAAAYFSRLDPDKYREVPDYLKLCELQNGFDNDPAIALDVTGKLFSDIVKLAPSKMKYENLIFISGCYENYDDDPVRGLAKALSVLCIARDELDGEKEEDGVSGELTGMRERIDGLIAVKQKRMKLKKEIKNMGGTDEEKQDR